MANLFMRNAILQQETHLLTLEQPHGAIQFHAFTERVRLDLKL